MPFPSLNTEPGPRCPVGTEESYAWGFLIGYTGRVPDVMAQAFDAHVDDDTDIQSWGQEGPPDFLSDYPDEARAFRRGYDAGCATAMDHIHPEDREA